MNLYSRYKNIYTLKNSNPFYPNLGAKQNVKLFKIQLRQKLCPPGSELHPRHVNSGTEWMLMTYYPLTIQSLTQTQHINATDSVYRSTC